MLQHNNFDRGGYKGSQGSKLRTLNFETVSPMQLFQRKNTLENGLKRLEMTL